MRKLNLFGLNICRRWLQCSIKTVFTIKYCQLIKFLKYVKGGVSMQIKPSMRALVAFISLACSISCISSSLPASAYTEPVLAIATDSIDSIICLDQNHKAQYPNSKRLYSKENSLDTIIYSNGDGTETAYFFDEPVKYYNDEGEVTDKSNRLYNISNYLDNMPKYSYASLDNDIKTYYPSKLTSKCGLIIETPVTSIKMYPVSDYSSPVIEKDGCIEYQRVFDDFTNLKYTPTFNGYKEDLIINQYSTNIYSFILETNGLTMASDENGSVHFLDNNNDCYATINPLFVYDSNANTNNITLNNYYEIEEINDYKYLINIVVDDAFLINPETVYPVIVDPTITINATGSGSSKSILDTPIYNGSDVAYLTAGANPTAILGYVSSSYGSGRLLMRFPGLANQSFWNEYYIINSATLTFNECSGLYDTSVIGAYNYTGESWDETSVYSNSRWNGVGSLLSTQSFSYPNDTVKSFNITAAVNNWISNSGAFNKGIIIKNNTNENYIPSRKIFYTTEGTIKPYLTVNYQPNRPIDDGIYYIKNKNSEKYLQVKNNATANGSQIVQYSYHGEKYQQFKVTYESDGYYTIRPMNVSGQTSVIDMVSDDNANIDGSDCQLYAYDSSYQRQKFMIRSAVGGGYQIGTKQSNGDKVLEVTNSSYADNEIVQIWTYSDSRTNDNWFFEKAFGCAWGFNAKGNGGATIDPYINCYLYALGETEHPTYYYLPMNYGESVETIAARVQSDVSNRNRNIRIIDGPYGHINDNEYRFCMRVGSHYVNNLAEYERDYHFWLQTDTGQWCDKAGWYNAATLKGDVNPSNENWNYTYYINQVQYTYINFYDSNTIYFAITE